VVEACRTRIQRGGRMRLDSATAAVCVPVPACGTTGPDPARNGLTGRLRNGLAGGLIDFFYRLTKAGNSKEPVSVNRLMEAGKATASVDPPLTVTFNWRRMQCPPPFTLFTRFR
jgi:hypothetical protein